MKVHVRKFRKDVYDEVNEPSKQALITLLEREGHTVISDKEDYNADVVTTKDGQMYYHEVERKAQWGKDWLSKKNYNLSPESGWPTAWEELRIPGRKRRLVQKYKDNIDNLFFYVFNCEYDKAWKVKGSQMTDDCIRRPDFARVHKDETFYHIPYQEAELVVL